MANLVFFYPLKSNISSVIMGSQHHRREEKDQMQHRTYIAIDLKSFYASVECVAEGWDPLTTNLVVADASRTTKTICLAVSPALKAFGVPGRPRLFLALRWASMSSCADGMPTGAGAI